VGNRASPEPPPKPPRWQEVIAPRAREEGEAVEPPRVFEVPADRLDDPLEHAPLFARLPEHAKDEIRERVAGAAGARADQVERRKETSHRWVVEGASLFAVSVALLQEPTRLEILLAALLGAGIGRVAARVKPRPFLYGLVFATIYAAFGAFSGFKNLVWAVLSVPIVLTIAMALAFTHGVQRFDSTEL
jgi:hypothetical protein